LDKADTLAHNQPIAETDLKAPAAGAGFDKKYVSDPVAALQYFYIFLAVYTCAASADTASLGKNYDQSDSFFRGETSDSGRDMHSNRG
jgi:predicted outer membrane protein